MYNLNAPELKARAFAAPWWNGIEILLTAIRDGKRSIATDVVFTEVEEGIIKEPSFRLEVEDAQVLMDDLWKSGLRPTEGSGSAGQLAATQKHLEDFRNIVQNLLEVSFKEG